MFTGLPLARVLLVEDNPDHRVVFEAMFHHSAYDLDIVADGPTAIAHFCAGAYALVLMDLQMPGMDGYATTRALRRWERSEARVPTLIVAFTASLLPEQLAAARDAGCDGHIPKPISRRALFQAIDVLLTRPPG